MTRPDGLAMKQKLRQKRIRNQFEEHMIETEREPSRRQKWGCFGFGLYITVY